MGFNYVMVNKYVVIGVVSINYVELIQIVTLKDVWDSHEDYWFVIILDNNASYDMDLNTEITLS